MTFTIRRQDGRSDAQVVIDLVEGGEPGRVYTYEEFAAALQAGTTRTYDQRAIGAAVRRAFRRLLQTKARTLHAVPNMGYRLAPATDHNRLAVARTQKAEAQTARGYLILNHVRWEEMDPQARLAHEGTLLIVGAMYQQQKALDKRLRALEDAIKGRKTDTAGPGTTSQG